MGTEWLTLKGSRRDGFRRPQWPRFQSRRPAAGVRGCGEGRVKIGDSTLGEELFTLKGHDGAVFNLRCRPVGHYLASAGFSDRVVKDMGHRDRQRAFHSQRSFQCCGGAERSDPTGCPCRIGEPGSDGEDLGSRDRQGAVRTQGPCRRVTSVAFSPDGQRLASGSDDRNGEDLGQRDRQGAVRTQRPCRVAS